MLDVSVSYDRYRFLGHEFLTWLWFCMENDPEALRAADPDLAELSVGNRMVIENHSGGAGETITIRGDDAGLEEGLLALGKGAMVTEMNLIYESAGQIWRFTVKGEGLTFSNLKTPETAAAESGEGDEEGAILEKIFLYDRAMAFMDAVFARFVRLRLSEDWRQTIGRLRSWIESSSEARRETIADFREGRAEH